MKRLKITGARTQPCLIPVLTPKLFDISPCTTRALISVWIYRKVIRKCGGNPNLPRTRHSMTVSKALVRSMKAATSNFGTLMDADNSSRPRRRTTLIASEPPHYNTDIVASRVVPATTHNHATLLGFELHPTWLHPMNIFSWPCACMEVWVVTCVTY